MFKAKLVSRLDEFFETDKVAKASKKLDTALGQLSEKLVSDVKVIDAKIEIEKQKIEELDFKVEKSKLMQMNLDIELKKAEIEKAATEIEDDLLDYIVVGAAKGELSISELQEALEKKLLLKKDSRRDIKALKPLFASLDSMEQSLEAVSTDPRQVDINKRLEELNKTKDVYLGVIEEITSETSGDDSAPTDKDPKTPVDGVEVGDDVVTPETDSKAPKAPKSKK